MELKDIIRNTTDTQPFNNFEVAVLREIYRTLGGKIKDSRRPDFYTLMDSNIIDNLAINQNILMYFYSLYTKNLDKSNNGDFSSIEEVVVPHMKEYEVKLYQSVNSSREIMNSVVADNSDDASNAMDWEFDYGDMVNPKLTTHLDDSITQGEYDDVFDSDVNVIQTLNESIKKILREELNTEKEPVIFIAGCSSAGECGRKYTYSHQQQGNMLQTSLGDNFIVKTFSHVNPPLSEIEKYNNPYVVMFSKGGDHANDVATKMKSLGKDLSKIYIVEPWTKSSTKKENVESAIKKIGNNDNVYGGSSPETGNNVAGKIRNGGDMEGHWNALTTVGNDIKKTYIPPVSTQPTLDINIPNINIPVDNTYVDPSYLGINESKKRKIKISESQLSKIEEDLKYWSVSDANPNKNKYEMGVELEEEVTSIPIYKDNNPHKRVYEKMRMEFPNTPEYVLQDYYRNIILMRAPGHRPAMKDILNTYNGDPIPYIKGDGNGWWYNYLKGPWKLQVLNVNPMDFDGRTVRAFEQRDFGNINAYNVPKDEERMETQKELSRDDGMNEPVIILQNPDGTYQLVEGWHRTMSILKMGDKPNEDYDDDYNDELWDEETPTELKDWDKVKLRAFVAPNPDFKEKK